MNYKVGDRVRIKSLDWYNRHTNGTEVDCGGIPFSSDMKRFCSRVMTISFVHADCYAMVEDLANYYTDEMIEGLVEEETQQKFKVGDRVITNKGYIGKFEGWVSDYQVKVLFEESGCDVVIHPKDLKLMEEETKSNVIEETKNYWDSIKDAWICPEGYQFKDENGNVINTTKIVLEKKKKEYPKTYGYCCDTLECCSYNVGFDRCETSYDDTLHNKLLALRKLIICRDAYWKLYGEDMGLGKPWEPDWNCNEYKYGIQVYENKVEYVMATHTQIAFPMPTEEMRDAFYENFKREIEICKELL